MDWLYKRTTTGKIQSWKALVGSIGYSIHFGQLNGKIQTNITDVKEGKQKRSLKEQIEFEVKALYKSKKDEGYKSLDDLYKAGKLEWCLDKWYCLEDKTEYPKLGNLEFVLQKVLPINNTNAQGHLKVMLSQPVAKVSKGVTKECWDKVKYPVALEPKLDGVRVNFKRDITIKPASQGFDLFPINNTSLSREAMSYDFGTTKLRKLLEPIFEKYPDLVLDGELYKHNHPQNEISGAMRSNGGGKYKHVFDIIEFHLYDMIDISLTFRERRQFIDKLSLEFKDIFDTGFIVLNDLSIVNDKESLDRLEEYWVGQNYEGIMAKNLDGMYRPDVRSYDSIKIKRFYDGEYEIIGLEYGARGEQDLVVVLKTKEGVTFKATAMGTTTNKSELCYEIDKAIEQDKQLMGTVKYKFISEAGKPSHAQFKGIR